MRQESNLELYINKHSGKLSKPDSCKNATITNNNKHRMQQLIN